VLYLKIENPKNTTLFLVVSKAAVSRDQEQLLICLTLETGMERDEDGVVLGSTRLPGSQRLHQSGDATREAGSLVEPMTAADSPSAIPVSRIKVLAE
jgi:hypothetical protein